MRGRELSRPSRFGNAVFEHRDGVREVGGEGTVDMGFEFGQVDFDVAVVLGSFVGLKVSSEGLECCDGRRAARLIEEATHRGRVGEDGRGSANLGAHVADRAHSGAAKRVDAFAEVLYDVTRSSLNGEDGGELKDDVCNEKCQLQIIAASSEGGKTKAESSPLWLAHPLSWPVSLTPMTLGDATS